MKLVLAHVISGIIHARIKSGANPTTLKTDPPASAMRMADREKRRFSGQLVHSTRVMWLGDHF